MCNMSSSSYTFFGIKTFLIYNKKFGSIERKPTEGSKNSGSCKKFSPIETVCRKEYENLKKEAWIDSNSSFSRSHAETLQ
ncbi:hypothetical protein BpHYR1_028358 [Brachionus plicatilis]|uniref:Uncharacterized protein n=1 Tax=Brachionus plicatilis TaxID=10195 RepID=A0A3M7QEP3_BRAPC|nr:hypothetical protein BpHYR1_028358 [Brachionus plicatilis]